ncbi:MAG: EamA family transporter [Chloroflexi bacterium HGW-Chloroflexi-5]|jgi:drug/metabolite transporter (DMT)-like permease|nr:MAG: EamA family transporter [Chloroflexi bacterium HGW-Chloroflexi-5]
MLPATNLLGILMAFTSALVWGSADFIGGLATRRRDQYQVVMLSALSGMALLVLAALIFGESFPTWKGVFWAALAGMAGAVGIASLYKGLSIGESAVVAPTSAVIGAGLPVAFGFLMEGLPDPLRLVGFVLAFAGIWIVSQTSTEKTGDHRKGFLLAVIGGFGFAGFMIFMSRVDSAKVFTPLIVSRSMVVLAALVMLKINKTSFPSVRGNWICLLTGVLDAGGNIFFMLAKHFTRLDTAVVLSSLYPAATVILTGLILKERISLKQWGGVIVCLAAIILITL